MIPPINTPIGLFVFVALCFGGVAGGLYVRSSRLSAHSCSVLNKSELRLFKKLRESCRDVLGGTYYVMAQVSYGEFLATDSRSLFFRFNCKRADFLIMDHIGQPIAVVEYQGSGHYGFSLVSRFKAMKADRVKRNILKRAGIPLLEVPAIYKFNILLTFFQSIKLA